MTPETLALALAKLDLHVFPCREKPETIKGKVYKAKTPYPIDGFYAGTTDPTKIKAFWKKHPDALVGVWTGESKIVVLDIDLKRNDAGEIVVDGYDSLDTAWLEIPETYSYSTLSQEGTHKVYLAPDDDRNLPRASDYRGLRGIDRQSSGSYVVWTGGVPDSRDAFANAPEWLLDATEVRSLAQFEGGLKEWYDSLEPGPPTKFVETAIERARAEFAEAGNDLTHEAIVKRQHEAIRLGAEGHSGIPELLSVLEELATTRQGAHSRDESEWIHEFTEALASGIKKHGDSIDLRKNMPAYSPAMIPPSVSDSLIVGTPGDKHLFNQLLRELIDAEPDDLTIVSILWNTSRTKELCREWGLPFVHKRVVDARTTPPPVSENPTIPDDSPVPETASRDLNLLTPTQVALVKKHPSFVDAYVSASYEAKGWVNKEYAIPAAWTMLSMAFGRRAFLPISNGIPLNLWFITLGYSGSGKTTHMKELHTCLDLLYKDGEGAYYNLGANSSPEALHEALLERDGKPSMIMADEAAGFFENIQRKDWMSGISDMFANWYDGGVPPSNKVRLKDLKGKSAKTSFNISMTATPDRTLKYLSTDMFETGFLARVNWTWAEEPDEHDERKYLLTWGEMDHQGINTEWYDLVTDVVAARIAMGPNPVRVSSTDEAEDLIVGTYMKMDAHAKTQDNYDSTGPAITRISETMLKCAALNALYQGRSTIEEVDALVAIYYTQRWYWTLFRVVEAAGKGEFAAKMDAIEKYIGRSGSGVTEPRIFDRFKGMVRFSTKDIDSVLDYLIRSNRIIRHQKDDRGVVKYTVNGGGKK